MSAGITAADAAAAADASESTRREEEEMTPYTSRDLNDNWEYKILRSATGRFRDPVLLHNILQEEARAGWIMVEKFDDMRVRLKRPASARANDAALGFDPYRSWVGTSQTGYMLFALLGALVVGVVAAAATLMLSQDAVHR